MSSGEDGRSVRQAKFVERTESSLRLVMAGKLSSRSTGRPKGFRPLEGEIPEVKALNGVRRDLRG